MQDAQHTNTFIAAQLSGTLAWREKAGWPAPFAKKSTGLVLITKYIVLPAFITRISNKRAPPHCHLKEKSACNPSACVPALLPVPTPHPALCKGYAKAWAKHIGLNGVNERSCLRVKQRRFGCRSVHWKSLWRTSFPQSELNRRIAISKDTPSTVSTACLHNQNTRFMRHLDKFHNVGVTPPQSALESNQKREKNTVVGGKSKKSRLQRLGV